MRILIFLLAFSLEIHVKAQERMEFYNGVRALGMGGATVAVVNDETSLIQNPAALGKLRNSFITVFDPELDISEDNERLVGADLALGFDVQSALDLLNAQPTKYLYNRMSVFPSIVVPNFGFGFYAKYELSANLSEDQSTYQLDYVNDIAFVIGYNFRFFDGKVKLGFNAKVNNRTELHNTYPSTTTGLDLATDGSEGLGIGSDVGLILTAPWKLLPTLAIVGRDVGGTRYDFQDGFFNSTNTRPENVDMSVDVGLAIFPIMGKGVRSTWTIEARDVMNLSTYTDQTRLYHGGFEINFYDAFFFRGGYNQRSWTAGMEFAVGNYQLQVASYGEDVGRNGEYLENRRYVAKFAYRF